MTIFGLDCKTSRPLIGAEPCVVEPGPLLGHIVLTGRQMFDTATTTPNKAFFNNLIQSGQAYFVVNAFGSPVETAAPTTETSDITQQQVVVTRGLPMVTVTLKRSYEFHKGFYQLSSQDQYSVILVYQNCLRVFMSKDGSSWGGFNVGMYEVLTYQEATGSTKAQTQVMYQIIDVEGYNTQGQYLTGLDFNPNTELNNVVDARLTVSGASGSNDVFVKAVWANNPSVNLEAFSSASFKLFINDVDTAIASVTWDAGTKSYKLTYTGTALANDDVIRVTTWDATATPPVNVAKVGTSNPKFYLGEGTHVVAGTPPSA